MGHWVNGLLTVGLIAGSVLAWPLLPEQIPIHFDLLGQPDGWAPSSPGRWFMIPTISVALTLFLYGCARVLPRYPSAINLGRDVRFVALGPNEQRSVTRIMQTTLHWTAAATTLMMGLIQLGAFHTARGDGGEAYLLAGVGIALLLVPGFALVGARRVRHTLGNVRELQGRARGTGRGA